MKNDGGPAFPITPIKSVMHGHPGMSLRDWFAGQALNGMLSSPQADSQTLDRVFAEAAYLLADAMLAEREKGNESS